MKAIKNLSALFLAVSMLFVMAAACFAADIPDYTEAFYVNDYAQVISAQTEEKLCELGYDLCEATGSELVLTTVDFLGGMDIEDYAKKMFNDWQLGDPEKNNGVLLLLVIGEENYWVMQGKGLEDSLSSGKLGSILEEFLEPDFAKEDYDAGALKTYQKLSDTICQIYGIEISADGSLVIPEPEPIPESVESEPFPIGAVILIIVVIIAVIMLIIFIARINNPRPKRLNGPIPPKAPDLGGNTYSYPDINIGGYGGLGRTGRYYGPTRRRTGTFTTTSHRTGGFGSSRSTGGFGGPSGRSSFGGSRGGRIGGGGGSRGGGAGRR